MKTFLTMRAKKNITKGDILRLCYILSKRKQYQDICEIEPEEICGGGLKFKFFDSSSAGFYKSLYLNVPWGKWGWIKHAMAREEWQKEKNKEILFTENEVRTFTFNAHSGAPDFTEGEKFFWEECLYLIGFVRAATIIAKPRNKKKEPYTFKKTKMMEIIAKRKN